MASLRRIPPPPLVLLAVALVTVVGFLGLLADADVPKVPALYVFGDSTADVGNNNYLPGTTAKANFPHNGVDFPYSRPTGRFSNGYNGIDFLASHMGFRRSPPPFLSLANKTNHQLVRGLGGVSFASGGSGILNSTGSTITFSKQIESFSAILSDLRLRLAIQQTDYLVSKSIFIISSGGNDIFGFFSNNNMPNDTAKEQFIAGLASNLKEHLMALYSLGARKFGIIDIAPIGCCPYPRSLHPTGGCIEILNELARDFNVAAKTLFHDLSVTLTGLKYSIGSSYEVISTILKNPAALGFKEVKTACCGAGKFNGESGCTPNATYCSDRGGYLFWDLLHPTHVTSKIAGLAIYSGSLQYATPINFKQLVEEAI